MATYQLANHEVSEKVQEVMELYHPELDDADVKVDVLLAYGPRNVNGDLTGPALRHNGCRCLAKTRILGLRDRVAGRGDAEILLDGDQIDEWGDRELEAIIDHELTHLELVVDGHGAVRRDDIERPRLKMRRHDHEFGWFDCVARRYGEAAVEVQQARQLLERDELRQLYLAGIMETA